MAYGGENQLTVSGWYGAAGRADEPRDSKLNRMLVHRFQIEAPEQMAPADTTVETANTKKLTILAGTSQAGDRFVGRGWGKVTNQNGADEATIRVRLGGLTGVAIVDHAGGDPGTGDHVWFHFDLWFEAKGAALTSKFHSHGVSQNTGDTAQDTFVEDNTSIDTTVEQDIVVTQDWNADNVANRFKLFELSAELFRTRQAWG